MTRQATDQLYIEVDYFTPEEYYVYTAEAESAITSQSTISCDAVKIVESISEFTAEFTQTATISHIEGADLFAFSEAELAAVAARIRFFNLETLAAFDIATDYGLIKQGASTEAADFALDITAELSRGFDIDMSAAFSLTADVNIFRPLAADLAAESNTSIQAEKTTDSSAAVASEFTQTADAAKITDIVSSLEEEFQADITAERIRGLDSAVSAATEFSAVISHIHGADLIVNGFATLTADVTVDYSGAAVVESVSTVTAAAKVDYSAQSNLTSAANVNGFGDVLLRNTQVKIDSGGRFNTFRIDNSITRFGSGSLTVDNTDSTITTASSIRWGTDGSTVKIVTSNYTWSSNDGINWTRADSNLGNVGVSALTYKNGFWFAGTRYSSNATSWADIASSYSPDLGRPQEIYFFNSAFRGISLQDIGTTIGLGSYSGSLGGTWSFTNIANTGLGELSGNQGQTIWDAGSSIVIAYNTSSGVQHIRWNGTVQQTVGIPSSSIRFTGAIAWDGSTTFVGGGRGSSPDNIQYYYYTKNNGTNWTVVTLNNAQLSAVRDISYANGLWFVSTGAGLRVSSDPATIFSGAIVDADISLLNTKVLYQYGKYLARDSFNNVKYSSDGFTWTTKAIEGVQGLSPQLIYTRGNGADLSEFSTVDFWLRGSANITFKDQINNNQLRLNLSAPNTISINQFNSTQLISNLSFTQTNVLPSGSWNHIRLVRSGTTLSLYINGTRRITGSYLQTISNGRVEITSSDEDAYIDEFLVTDQLLNDPSATSITVPTVPWKNTAETDLLLHFDDSFADDSRAEIVITANLVSQSTVTAASTVDYDILVPAMVTQSSLTAQGFRTAEIVLTAFSAALVLTEIDIIKDADAELTVTAEVVTDVTRIQEAASAINSTATVSSDVSVITDTAADFNNTFALSTVVEVTRDNAADLSVVGDITAAADRIRDVDTALQSQSQVVAEAVKIITSDSQFTSTAELLAAADRSRDHASALTADFVQTAQAEATLSAISEQSAEFTVTAQGFRTAEIVLSGFSAALVLTDVERIRDTAAELQDQFTLFVQTANVIDFDIDPINAAASLDGSLDRIRLADCSLSNESLLDCSVLITRDFSSDLTTDSSVAIEVSRILTTDSNIYAASDLNGSLSVIRDAAINTSSTASMTVAGVTVIFGEGHLFADTTVTAQGFKTTEIVLTGFSAALVLTAAERIRDTAADVASAATTTASITVVQQLFSDMSAATEVTAIAGVQANAAAALQANGFVLTTAREIRLDSIVYKIGSETRVYKIPSESRIYKIRSK